MLPACDFLFGLEGIQGRIKTLRESGGGGGLDLLALLAFFPFCHFSFFLPKIRGAGPPCALP